MTKPNLKVVKNEVDDLVRDLRPLLSSHHRSVQWAALAELMAIWLVEHCAVRAIILGPLLEVHVKTVRRLVDSYVADEKKGS